MASAGWYYDESCTEAFHFEAVAVPPQLPKPYVIMSVSGVAEHGMVDTRPVSSHL
jgi:hypothetical protein